VRIVAVGQAFPQKVEALLSVELGSLDLAAVSCVGNSSMQVSIPVIAEDNKWQCEVELRHSIRSAFNQRLVSGICQPHEA
jgi:hypothetical protein